MTPAKGAALKLPTKKFSSIAVGISTPCVRADPAASMALADISSKGNPTLGSSFLTPHWGVTPGPYATLGLQYITLELQHLSLESVVCVCLTPHWDVTIGAYAT